MASNTTRRDMGAAAIRKFAEENKNMKDAFVKVGVLESAGKHKGSDLTVAEVATFQEFGTENIPERSFIRSTTRANREQYKQFVINLKKAVIRRKYNVPQALGLLGLKIASDIKKTIQKGVSPPLAESTIKKKGSSKPLIDTGQLIASINYEVTSE